MVITRESILYNPETRQFTISIQVNIPGGLSVVVPLLESPDYHEGFEAELYLVDLANTLNSGGTPQAASPDQLQVLGDALVMLDHVVKSVAQLRDVYQGWTQPQLGEVPR